MASYKAIEVPRYALKGHTLWADRLYRSKRTSTFYEDTVNRNWSRFREVQQRDLRGQILIH
jgi:hypothetical protein